MATSTSLESQVAFLTQKLEEMRQEKALLQSQYQQELEARVRAAVQQVQGHLADQSKTLPLQLKLQPLRQFEGVRGKHEDTDAWLFQAEQMFRMTGVDSDEHRIDYAGQALTGHAATWFFSRRKSNALTPLVTWEDFKKGLRAQFQTADSYDTAKKQLYALKQGRDTLQQYTDRFLQLNSIVGDVSEKNLMFLYRNGLNSVLQVEVLKANCQSFHETMVLVEKLENIHVQFLSEPSPPIQQHAKDGMDRSGTSLGDGGSTPMDLDLNAMRMQLNTLQQQNAKHMDWQQSRAKQLAEKLCFGCNKPSHIRKDCPTNPWKPKGQGEGQVHPSKEQQ